MDEEDYFPPLDYEIYDMMMIRWKKSYPRYSSEEQHKRLDRLIKKEDHMKNNAEETLCYIMGVLKEKLSYNEMKEILKNVHNNE